MNFSKIHMTKCFENDTNTLNCMMSYKTCNIEYHDIQYEADNTLNRPTTLILAELDHTRC